MINAYSTSGTSPTGDLCCTSGTSPSIGVGFQYSGGSPPSVRRTRPACSDPLKNSVRYES